MATPPSRAVRSIGTTPTRLVAVFLVMVGCDRGGDECDDDDPTGAAAIPETYCDGIDQDCNGWDRCPLPANLQALLQTAFAARNLGSRVVSALDAWSDQADPTHECHQDAEELEYPYWNYSTSWQSPCATDCGGFTGSFEAAEAGEGSATDVKRGAESTIVIGNAAWSPAEGDPCNVGGWTMDGTASEGRWYQDSPGGHNSGVSASLSLTGSTDGLLDPQLPAGDFEIDWDSLHSWQKLLGSDQELYERRIVARVELPDLLPPQRWTWSIDSAFTPVWAQGAGPPEDGRGCEIEADGSLTVELLVPVTLQTTTSLAIDWEANPNAVLPADESGVSSDPGCDGAGRIWRDGVIVDTFAAAY